MRFVFFLFSLLFAYSTLADVEFDFTALSNGRIKVVIQGITGGNYQVNFYKKHKNDSDKGDFVDQTKSQSGGLSHVVNTTFKNDEQVSVAILNFRGNGQHLTQVSRTYGNLSGQTNPPRPNPTYQPGPSVSNNKIKEYADQQARTVANRIAKTYGERENFRHNFVVGLWNGYNDYRAYDNNRRFGYGNYQEGYRKGNREGEKNGERAGASDASRLGQDAGANDARSRFVVAINDPSRLNTQMGQVIPPYYSGATLTGGYQQPSLQQKIQELEDDFRSRVCRTYRWDYDGFSLGCEWSLSDAYRSNGTYTFIDSWFRDDYAYREWINNGLGGRYDYNIYNQLDNDQKETFRRYFKATYDRVIDDKFNQIKYQPNRNVQELGYSYGVMLGKEMAYQQGLSDGYKSAFIPSSIQAFNKTYFNQFQKGFEARVDYHSKQPVLESLTGFLDGNFIPGSSMDLVITKIVNLGLVDASREQIQVQGTYVTALPLEQTLTIPALSSLESNIKLKNVATINYNVPSDAAQQVNVSIANLKTTLSFTVSWDTILNNFVLTAAQDPKFSMAASYIHSQLENELNKARSYKNNVYEAGLQSRTLLAKTVNLYNRTSSQGKDNLNQISHLKPQGVTLCDIANDVKILQVNYAKIRNSFIPIYKTIDSSCVKR